jgi:hypothetical protein
LIRQIAGDIQQA